MHTINKRAGFTFAIVAAIFATGLTTPVGAGPVLRSIQFTDNFSSGTLDRWQLPYPEDWVIGTEVPLHFLHMLRNREPLEPRRPVQFALLKGASVGSFTFQANVRRQGHSVLMVFNYVDTLHFYYTHLSVDPGAKVDVHNGIFLVDGGPRHRIAGMEAAPVLPDQSWHKIRIQRDIHSGSIEVFVDTEPSPRFSVTDRTLTCGQVGLGSFDETGDFADVRLTSQDAGCQPGHRLIQPASTN